MGGPWSVPFPPEPWQVAQRSSYRPWPARAKGVRGDGLVCATEPVCASGPPLAGPFRANTPRGRPISATAPRTRPSRIPRRAAPVTTASPDDEQRREQPDPHDVDEVPVVGGHLDAGV